MKACQPMGPQIKVAPVNSPKQTLTQFRLFRSGFNRSFKSGKKEQESLLPLPPRVKLHSPLSPLGMCGRKPERLESRFLRLEQPILTDGHFFFICLPHSGNHLIQLLPIQLRINRQAQRLLS